MSGPANDAPAPGVVVFQVPDAPNHTAQAEVHLDPNMLSSVADTLQLRLLDTQSSTTNSVERGALGGGDAEPTGPPLNLRLLAIDRASGLPVGLPDLVATSIVEVYLPLPVVQLIPGEQVAWLMELDGPDGQFFGYTRPLARFDPLTQQLVVSVPATQLQDTLFLPVIMREAYVRNSDPDVHIWSSPLPDAVDLGVAAPQFTRMQVLAPQLGGRLLVWNAFTAEQGWIDVNGVGPVQADDGLPAVLAPPALEVAGVTTAPAPTSYTVQSGDWLKTIAAQHGVSLQALLAANPMPDPDHIVVGQQLWLPSALPSQSAP